MSESLKGKTTVYSRWSTKGTRQLKLSTKRKKRRPNKNLLDSCKRRRLSDEANTAHGRPKCTAVKTNELVEIRTTYVNSSQYSTASETNELNKEHDNCANKRKASCSYENKCDAIISNEFSENITDRQECEPSKVESDFTLQGRRIVDINSFIKQIQAIDDHEPFHCSFKDMVPVREVRKGLNSKITFKCMMCSLESFVWLDPIGKLNYMDVNVAAVSGTLSTGGGHAQLEEITSTLDIPAMSGNTFKRYHDRLGKDWEKTASTEMEKAARLEAEEAIKRDHVAADGTPLLTVTADGSWAKRTNKHQYNSLSGVAAIVGYYTKKVLFIGVKNKYCTICDRAEKKGTTAADHACSKNWGVHQTSTSMESAIILEGFLASEEMYSVRYAKIVADGDSSVYKNILDARPYKSLTVEKIECSNHLLRNYCNKLRDIAATSDGGRFPICLRKKIGNSILRLRMAVKKAAEYRNKTMTDDIELSISELRKDILNGPNHVFGSHSNCAERGYFCDAAKTEESSIINDLISTGLFEKVMLAAKHLARNTRSLLYCMDNNAAEQYNSSISKYIGGKRINFCRGNSYQTRCAGAVVQHNTGTAHYTIHKQMYGRSPGFFCKKVQLKRKRRTDLKRHSRNVQKKYPKQSKKCSKKLFSGFCDKDSFYGPNAQRPDMDDQEFEKERSLFLDSLRRNDEQRKNLEKMTVLQSGSGVWLQERRKLLTASHFGSVCKRRKTTKCDSLVKSILYGTSLRNEAIMHGRENEKVALEDLQNSLGISIRPCGLFVDEQLEFLGATPDGIIDDDGIVEVKCPFSSADLHPEDAIAQGKIKSFKCQDGKIVLNKNHDHFFQVQGQLHITKRNYCIYIVWTRKGMYYQRIKKDDNYWQKEMKDKLVKFYMDCLLPEIIDPRYTRSMPIRNPDYILNAGKQCPAISGSSQDQQ